MLLVGVLVFLQKDQWLAVATALPTNPVNADKARIFSGNIQSLYPELGSADDLDKILGTAQLDTVYIAVANNFNLRVHYNLREDHPNASLKAALLLREHTRVLKSDYGELKVKVWDIDKQLAPQLANAILKELDAIHSAIQHRNNKTVLANIQADIDGSITNVPNAVESSKPISDDSLQKLLLSSSFQPVRSGSELSFNLDPQQKQQYQQLADQIKIVIASNPSVLTVIESAHIPTAPDKPKRLLVILATGFIALGFSILLALVLDRNKKS
jgi:hypothetical protein